MPVRFSYNTTNIEICNPIRDNILEVKKHQTLGRTASGQVYVYDKGIETKKLELEFKNLREDEKTNIENFFSLVDGILNQFSYESHRGDSYTARFLDPVLRFSETKNEGKFAFDYSNYYSGYRFSQGFWNVSIKLEVF